MVKAVRDKQFTYRCSQTECDAMGEMKYAASLLGLDDDCKDWPKSKWMFFAFDILMRGTMKGQIAQGQIDGCEDVAGLFVSFIRAQRGIEGYSLVVDMEGDLWVKVDKGTI